jgi:hypothetical protein
MDQMANRHEVLRLTYQSARTSFSDPTFSDSMAMYLSHGMSPPDDIPDPLDLGEADPFCRRVEEGE